MIATVVAMNLIAIPINRTLDLFRVESLEPGRLAVVSGMSWNLEIQPLFGMVLLRES